MINKTPRKFQLRTALVVPFVLQIVAAVGLVGYLSFRNGEKAVNNLADRLMISINDRVDQHLDNYFSIPHRINQANIDAIDIGLLDLNNFNRAGLYFWKQAQAFENIGFISYGLADGRFIGAGPTMPGKGVTIDEVSARTEGKLFTYAVNEQGDYGNVLQVNPYDTLTTEWYVQGVKAGKPSWTSVYSLDQLNFIAVEAVRPIFAKNGKLLGVIGVDLQLSNITDFLRNLKVSYSGRVFVMERDGQLIGNSGSQPSFDQVNGKSQRFSALNISDPLIQKTTETLKNRFNSFQEIKEKITLTIEIQGQRYFVLVNPWKQEFGLDWLIVTVLPESDFMAQINENTRNTLLLSLVALVAAIAVGILTARSITRPVIQITKASEEISTGNLDKRVDTHNFIEIQEIHTLENSFNSMAGQLKESFATLETKNEELRIAEESYRSIFENALEGIFQSSPSGRYINANPALAKIYGYHSPAEMIESITNIGEQVYVDPQTRDEVRGLLETQETVKGFEYRSYCKDRSMIWTQIDARVVKDMNNNVLYYEGIVQNISDRKRREDDLRKQLAELKIEIDHTKREKEVAMLTESSFFKEVQQEMAEVNVDEFWS